MQEALQLFHPVIGRWFERRLGAPTPPQAMGWPVIAGGNSALILAPTGSGKTLAAFLVAIDAVARRLIEAQEKDQPPWGVQVLYVSPLKALANDVRKNLLEPLAEMAEVAAGMKAAWPEIAVAVRTGDTPAKERAGMLRHPPQVLITTPESLNLLLTTQGRSMLSTVRHVIVDEVHALAGSKRGVFLSLLLERLEQERRAAGVSGRGVKIAPGVYIPAEPMGELVRIGLSATAQPEEVIARWLAGFDDDGMPRKIAIVGSGQRKRLDLRVVCPFAIGAEETEPEGRAEPGDGRNPGGKGPQRVRGTGHWPEVTRAILQLIREHRSTLVFGNSRRLIERLAARFQEEILAEETGQGLQQAGQGATARPKREEGTVKIPVILPHHGSIAREVRVETEQALKRGEVDAVLATSSLELGIDIGSLDLVVQIDSPGNVAAGLQRVGRAGHLEKATAKGRFMARGSQELASFGALLPLMFEGRVEETRVPANCLDVLAQQVVAACVPRPWKRGELYRVFRRAMPFRDLSEKQFDAVVGMLSKRADRVTAQGLRPRLSFDRVNDELILMPGAAQVVLVNSGVITDTGQYPVYLAGATRGRVELGAAAPREAQQEKWGRDGRSPGVRLGELDEEFVYETREGDRIVLGSQTWRVVRIDADRVLVEHAEPGSSRMPFWRGESAPRSDMLGQAVAEFYGELESRLRKEAEEQVQAWLVGERHFDERAAENAVVFFGRQLARGALPTGRRIVVEHFVDRTGEPIIAVLCPLGSRVNYALRLALEGQFARRRVPAQIVHHDDGLIIRPPVEVGEIPENPLAWLRSRTLEQEIVDQLEGTALFGLRFRQNAARALMLPRMTLTQRTPLWQQRLRARHLLALVKQQRNFPIIVETYRECLQDVLNVPLVTEVLRRLESGEMAAEVVKRAEGPSPLANSLFSQFQQAYLYQWDDPLLPEELEPTVDQQVLDEILRGRSGAAGSGGAVRADLAGAWEAADEEALRRRIAGLEYPARTAEELLEKIETAGAAGVTLGADDPAWEAWAVGGAADARRMLIELSEKGRLYLASVGGGAAAWVAAENVALLHAAAGTRVRLKRHAEKGKPAPASLGDLPEALREAALSADEARRLIVEQVVKREPVTRAESVAAAVPWMKEATRHVEALEREGLVWGLPDGRLVWGEYAEQLRAMALRRQRRGAGSVDMGALQRHLLTWQHVAPGEGGGEMIDAVEDVLDVMSGLAFPLEFWEHEVLAARVPGYVPAVLDAICRGGHRVWVGGGGESGEEGIAFWPRHLVSQRPMLAGAALSCEAQRVAEALRGQGASFQFDLQMALGLEDGAMALALRELVGAGLASCDQLEGLREVLRVAEVAARDRARAPAAPRLHATHARHVPRPSRLPRNWWKQAAGGTAGALGGRWFLLAAPAQPQTAMEVAERAADRVERFLRRTGFACRELLEPLDGPWKDAYDVLTRMEWAGTVRRGYFVDGIAGSQFALPGAPLLQKRPAAGESGGAGVTWLSMLDPANIWARAGARWISDAGMAARVPRAQGNWVALVEGRPVLAAVSWGQRLIPLPAPEEQQQQALRAVAALLSRLPRQAHPYLLVKHLDQREILGTPAEEILRSQGFSRDTQGLRLYRQYATAPGGARPEAKEPT